MTVRYVCGAVTALVLTCGAPTVARANPQTHDPGFLPAEESGMVTVAGCLQRGGKHGDDYVLTNPIQGPINSVPEARCSFAVDGRALDLDKNRQNGINESLLGHWIEVSGRLEKETHASADSPRELGVRSFRVLPVVPPRVEAAAAPIAAPYIQPPPAEVVATTGISPAEAPPAALPKTSSPLPAIGLFGLLALAGGFALRGSRLHERG
jgi:hypothetical protein